MTDRAADGKPIFEFGQVPFGLLTKGQLEQRLGRQPGSAAKAYVKAGVGGTTELFEVDKAIPIDSAGKGAPTSQG